MKTAAGKPARAKHPTDKAKHGRANVFINGSYAPPGKACVSALDRGFLLGDGLFETLLVRDTTPVFLKEHLSRLRKSARAMGIRYPYSDQETGRIIQKAVANGRTENASIRITVTRGQSPAGLGVDRTAKPTVMIWARPLPSPFSTNFPKSLHLHIVAFPSALPAVSGFRIKSINYFHNILAFNQALKSRRHDAVLLTPQGKLSECSTSNLFFVQEGILKTPADECGPLPGITRDKVIAVALRAGMIVEKGAYDPLELQRCSEAFVTSSVRGIVAVTAVDGHGIGNKKAGPITRALIRRYEQLQQKQMGIALRSGGGKRRKK